MTHVFKKSLMMAALVAAFAVAQVGSAMAQADVGQVNAILDLDTGEVTVDIGAGLQVFGLLGVPFDNAAAAAGLAVIDPIPAFPLGETQGPGTQNDANGIGVLNTGFLPVGEFSLGNILLPAFRTEASLGDFLLRFDGAGNADPLNADPGVGIGSGNITIVGGGEVVPEPGSLSLLALAGLGVVARRRR